MLPVQFLDTVLDMPVVVLRQVPGLMVQKTVVRPQLQSIEARRHSLSFSRGSSPWSSLFPRPQRFSSCCSIPFSRCPCCAGRAVSPVLPWRRSWRSHSCSSLRNRRPFFADSPQLQFIDGRRHPFRAAYADPHGPDYSADHRVSTVAVLSWWSMFLLAGCVDSSLLGYDCAFALRGSGARVSVCGYADMGYDCVLALLGWCWCSLPSSVTATWARIALSLSLVWCLCSFLSWRRDSSLGLPIQLTTEIVQWQPIDKVFDGRLCMFLGCRYGTWRRRSRSHIAVLRSWTRLLTCPLICVYRCLTWSRQCRKRGVRRCSSWTRLPCPLCARQRSRHCRYPWSSHRCSSWTGYACLQRQVLGWS